MQHARSAAATHPRTHLLSATDGFYASVRPLTFLLARPRQAGRRAAAEVYGLWWWWWWVDASHGVAWERREKFPLLLFPGWPVSSRLVSSQWHCGWAAGRSAGRSVGSASPSSRGTGRYGINQKSRCWLPTIKSNLSLVARSLAWISMLPVVRSSVSSPLR
ncbi:hypothetical protein BC567DRAFT_17693 [Phyllosticta citribraziliensis]